MEPTEEKILEIYQSSKTIAVVGASGDPSKSANEVPAYLVSQGYRVIPVNPKGGELFGEQVYPSLLDVPDEIDIVDVFRPAEETPEIAKQAVQKKAKVLWLQGGIFSEEAAAIAEEGGLVVIMDRCMMVTHRNMGLTK